MHVAIVGAGIIGLSVAYHLLESGVQLTLLDRDPEGDKCSFGNAGGIAVTEVVPAAAPGVLWRVPGWILDPLGPLAVRPSHLPKLIPWLIRFAKVSSETETDRISRALAAINLRVYDDLVPMLRETQQLADLQRKGALTIYETEEGFRRDQSEWALKRSRGIVCEDLYGTEARDMEPALSPRVQRAVFTPQWSHINDPKSLVDGIRNFLLARGVRVIRADVVHLHSGASSASLKLADGGHVSADRVVIAAGAWSGTLARQLGDRVLLESERGYNSTLPNPAASVQRELIFAERKFVATPLSCGLRIGGAAEFGGLAAAPNFRRSRALLELARLYLPSLRIEGGTEWAGHRPTTPDSLPVIGPSQTNPNVLYAFGHGHLGLTQAATTGRLIADLVSRKPSVIDIAPYAVERFRHSGADEPVRGRRLFVPPRI